MLCLRNVSVHFLVCKALSNSGVRGGKGQGISGGTAGNCGFKTGDFVKEMFGGEGGGGGTVERLPPPKKRVVFLNEGFLAARHEEG